MSRHRYTPEELDACAVLDWKHNAECAEKQAIEGPFYPEHGTTAESLLAYAAECRAKVEKYKNGGAHAAILANG